MLSNIVDVIDVVNDNARPLVVNLVTNGLYT